MKEIGNIQRYLSNVLGLEFEVADETPSLAPPLSSFFDLLVIHIDTIECCLLFPVEDTTKPSLLIKRVNAIEQSINKRCVVVLTAMDKTLRRELIKSQVSFIVSDRQLFIPFLGAYLSEMRLNRLQKRKTFTPAAQLLVLYHLQSDGVENMFLSEIADKLHYPLKTVSSIVNELKDTGLCIIEELDPRAKSIKFIKEGRELWELTKPMLSSPISKAGYIPMEMTSVIQDAQKSGDEALSRYTDMGIVGRHTVALDRRSDLAKALIPYLEGTEASGSIEVELWKYDPSVLARNGYVDPLSMYLCNMNNPDERIQGELERLIDKVL